MNEHVVDLLPFYLNETLPVEKREAVETHLSDCPPCQEALGEWEALAGWMQDAAPPQRVEDFPALSAVVRVNLRGRPTIPEAVLAATSLIGAQRVYFKESWLIQIFAVTLLVGVLAAVFLPVESPLWAAVPYLILVPFFAVLVGSLFDVQEEELGDEIVAATPTHPGVLIFARLTLALGAITGLSLLGSLLIAGLGRVSLVWLVVTWLGPLLWLSALTTLLALLWSPWGAAGISITLWGGVLLLLVADEYSLSLLGFSLAPLLQPTWGSFGLQALLAGFLWLLCWLWLVLGTPASLRFERGE